MLLVLSLENIRKVREAKRSERAKLYFYIKLWADTVASTVTPLAFHLLRMYSE